MKLSKFRLIIHPYLTPDMPMVISPYEGDDVSEPMRDFETFAIADDCTTKFLDSLIDAFDSRILILKLEELSEETNTYRTIRLESITHS